MILVASDADLKADEAAQELRNTIGTLLATTYPGYRWRVEANPHPTRPFVDVRCEHAGHPMAGFTVQPWRHYSSSSMRAYVLTQAGELLERFHLNRRGFDAAEFLARPKTFAGIVLPEL